MADSIRITGRHAADPTFSGTLPVPSAHPVQDFLSKEKARQHIAYEVACRDRDLLIRQSRTNPASVRADRIETACRLADRAHERDLYIGELLSGFPVVTS